jgi:hypothetical protein
MGTAFSGVIREQEDEAGPTRPAHQLWHMLV